MFREKKAIIPYTASSIVVNVIFLIVELVFHNFEFETMHIIYKRCENFIQANQIGNGYFFYTEERYGIQEKVRDQDNITPTLVVGVVYSWIGVVALCSMIGVPGGSDPTWGKSGQ